MNGKHRRGFGAGGRDGETIAEKNLMDGPLQAGDESGVAVKGEGEDRGPDHPPLFSQCSHWVGNGV